MSHPTFCDHVVVTRNRDEYDEFTVPPSIVLKAWRHSLFAHEFLSSNGTPKDERELGGDALQRFIRAAEAIKRGEAVEKPVLGIGLYEGIEIGIGRETVYAASRAGLKNLPVCVRKAQKSDILAALGLPTSY